MSVEEALITVDVLMVWHSFMLNPRTYLEDCLRFGMMGLWKTGLPWKAVDAVIDTRYDRWLVSVEPCV